MLFQVLETVVNQPKGSLYSGTYNLEMEADNAYKHTNKLILDLDKCYE